MKHGWYEETNSKGEKFLLPNPPKKITRKKFMDIICKYGLDVRMTLIGKYPYKEIWKFKDNEIFGYIEPNGEAFIWDFDKYRIMK